MKFLRSLIIAVRAIPDLGRTETIDGVILRIPRRYKSDGDGGGSWGPSGYIAVDDGTTDLIRAVRGYRPGLEVGQVVHLTITPRMRHVREVQRGESQDRRARTHPVGRPTPNLGPTQPPVRGGAAMRRSARRGGTIGANGSGRGAGQRGEVDQARQIANSATWGA